MTHSSDSDEFIAPILSQKEVARQYKTYTYKRQRGEIPIVKTKYNTLNKAFGGSLEPNTVLTIGGSSGSGKSTLSKRIIYSIHEYMQGEGKKCVSLCFNYEMLAFKTFGREMAHLSKRTVTELYSSETPIDIDELGKINNYFTKQLEEYPIYYVETPSNHRSIRNTVKHYWQKLCDNDTLFIVELDHTLLIKSSSSDSNAEKRKIDKLMSDVISLKKEIQSKGGQVIFILISQLNRNIESIDRVKIPNLHRPQKGDLVQSDNVYQGSDYVLILHNPSKMNLQSYTERGYPTTVYMDKEKKFKLPFVYFHILKNRDGEPDSQTVMIGNLKYFEFIELTGEKFYEMCKQNSEESCCVYDVKSEKEVQPIPSTNNRVINDDDI